MNLILKEKLNDILLIKRFYKEIIVTLIDIISCFLSLCLTYIFINQKFSFPFEILISFLICLIFIPIFYFLKVNKIIFRFISFFSILRIYFAISIYFLLLILCFTYYNNLNISILFTFVYCLIFALLVLLSRILMKSIYEYSVQTLSEKVKTLIFFNNIETFSSNDYYLNNYNILGFIDENKQNWGKKINNYIIFPIDNIYEICKKKSINTILIINSNDVIYVRERLLKKLNELPINIKIIPDVKNLLASNTNINNLLNVVSLNLINRKIKWDKDSINNEINNKNILITGAGGSIGSELCRQIILFNPSKLICLDISEYNLFNLKNELLNYIKNNQLNFKIFFKLVSINNLNQINYIFEKENINIVFHAAAYKHVDLIENNVIPAIETNIFGFINIISLSLKYKVNKFLFVSTDKAVRPTSIMGFTKRFSEIYIQYLNHNKKNGNTALAAVRFGNVFGSAGSVIELFNNQISNKLPITLTHEEASRYFMTIPEASILLIQSLSLLSEGEIFVLDMGKPFKIIEIARKMIFFAGLTEKNSNNPYGDIPIKIIGLKKGEKIHEELLISNKLIRSKFNDIFIDQIKFKNDLDITNSLENLKILIKNNNEDAIINLLRKEVY